MLISMTGYGRGLWQNENSQVQVELRSVNGRYLNLRFKMPDGLMRFESELENRLKQKIGRGSVTCQVQWKREDKTSSFNTEKLINIWKELNALSEKNNIKGDVNLSQLALLPELSDNNKGEILEEEELKLLEEGLFTSLDQALENINSMRQAEGFELKKQLLSFAEDLKSYSQKINELAPRLSSQQQSKFIERVKSLRSDIEVSEADLSRELAVLADRADISEEVTRLDSHLIQLNSILEEGGPVGRKLDFILQEINREINTMGSKSSDTELSRLVVEMKALAEKIREQVQNIE